MPGRRPGWQSERRAALALFLRFALGRMRPGYAPSLWFAWKPVLALSLAAGAGYLLRDWPLVAVCVAVLVFVGGRGGDAAVPADAYHAFGLGRRREDEADE